MKQTLAILVGGGPAPGINGVIASAAMEAFKYDLRVIGIYDGYRDLAAGRDPRTIELTFDHVSRIHTTGGSILRTSRTNPARDEQSLQNCIDALNRLEARYLVCIGGDDTTFGAARIAEKTNGRIGVATVPKTIDNDLPLPDNAPTFGFETARQVGADVVVSLMEDARTTSRWYVVITMGRKSGALALGICKSAGATLAVIPEELPDEVDLSYVVDTIVGAIVKRRSVGREHGIAVVAEGVAERLPIESLAHAGHVERDSFGNVALADLPLGIILRDGVRKRLDEIGLSSTIHAKDIGYELRCAKPIAFDEDYTRTLGFGAVRYLIAGGSGALISLVAGHVVPVALEELLNPQTGRIRTRSVDTTAETYHVARDYMMRLETHDFVAPELEKLANVTNLSPTDFKEQFQRVALD